MTRLILAASLLALAACSQSQPVTAAATTWHVDYASGSDAASGTSPNAAWKHAPGDPNATGRPAEVKLAPGDTVVLRGGVAYRGGITVPANGTVNAPITYTGAGFGTGMGIIDGSEPVQQARKCASAADCGGAPDWKMLHRIEFDPPALQRVILFGKTGPYWMSQFPIPSDPFLADATNEYLVTPLASLPALQAGTLLSPELARIALAGGGKMELAFWVLPNFIRRVPVLGISGDTLRFDPEGVRFYENRDGRVALNGSFAGLAPVGTFAVLKPGLAIARLRPEDSEATLSIGSGRFGVEIGGRSNIAITGIHFRNLAGSAGVQGEGRAISSSRAGTTNLLIKSNLMGPAFIETSNSGLVRIVHGRNVKFISNRIEDIALGSIFVAGGHNVGDVTVQGNVIRRIGRSGIYLLSVDGALVSGNILSDVRGIHGNAITTYMANRNIMIEQNCVVNSARPMTFHGHKEPEIPNRITVRNNIFLASPDGQGAINSWGRQTNTVTITDNILVGPRHAILLNNTDRNLVITGNDTSGIAPRGASHETWEIANNRETFTLAQAVQGEFSEDGCKVPASRLNLVVTRSPR